MFQQLKALLPEGGQIVLTLAAAEDGKVRLVIQPVRHDGKPTWHPLVFDSVTPAELDSPDINLEPVAEAAKTIPEAVAAAAAATRKTEVLPSGNVKTETKTGRKTTVTITPPSKTDEKPPAEAPAAAETESDDAKARKEAERAEKKRLAEEAKKAKQEQEAAAAAAAEAAKAKTSIDELRNALAKADELDLFAAPTANAS